MDITLISGGQTGADLGALVYGLLAKRKTGGIAAAKFKTVDGEKPEFEKLFNLQDLGLSYRERTIANVKQSSATLIVSSTLSSGTKLTINTAEQLKKPYLYIPISSTQITERDLAIHVAQAKTFIAGLSEVKFDMPLILNCAGNSSKNSSTAFEAMFRILNGAFDTTIEFDPVYNFTF